MSDTAFAASLVIGFNVFVAMLITGLWVLAALVLLVVLGILWYNRAG